MSIPDLDGFLTIDLKTVVRKFDCERAAVDAFNEARTERGVNLAGSFYDAVDNAVIGLHTKRISNSQTLFPDFAEEALLDDTDAFDLALRGEALIEALVTEFVFQTGPWADELLK